MELSTGSTASSSAVIETMLQVLAFEDDRAQAATWTVARASDLLGLQLRAKLSTMCRNVAAVEAAVRSLRDTPRRSSSLVEALNAIVRGAQQVHRTVSDDLLALYALRWNFSPRTEGPRRGSSPFARLGVDLADDKRSWIEVLIEEMDRAQRDPRRKVSRESGDSSRPVRAEHQRPPPTLSLHRRVAPASSGGLETRLASSRRARGSLAAAHQAAR